MQATKRLLRTGGLLLIWIVGPIELMLHIVNTNYLNFVLYGDPRQLPASITFLRFRCVYITSIGFVWAYVYVRARACCNAWNFPTDVILALP